MSQVRRPEMIRLDEYTNADIKDLGAELYSLVNREDTQAMLCSLRLPGVIIRHTVSPNRSVQQLKRARAKMDAGEQDTYVLCSTEPGSDELVGMAARIPSLPWRQQRAGTRPNIARRFPFLLSRAVDMTPFGANVSAWVTTEPDREPYYDELSTVYDSLRTESEDLRAWTLLPSSLVSSQEWDGAPPYDKVMRDAGYLPVHEVSNRKNSDAYFDDYEISHRSIGLTRLYVALGWQ